MTGSKVRSIRQRCAIPFQIWKRGEPPKIDPNRPLVFLPARSDFMSREDAKYLFTRSLNHGIGLDTAKVRPVELRIPRGEHVFSAMIDVTPLATPLKELVDGRESPFRGRDGMIYWSLYIYTALDSGYFSASDIIGKMVFSGKSPSPNTDQLYAQLSPEMRAVFGNKVIYNWVNIMKHIVEVEVEHFIMGRTVINKLSEEAGQETPKTAERIEAAPPPKAIGPTAPPRSAQPPKAAPAKKPAYSIIPNSGGIKRGSFEDHYYEYKRWCLNCRFTDYMGIIEFKARHEGNPSKQWEDLFREFKNEMLDTKPWLTKEKRKELLG